MTSWFVPLPRATSLATTDAGTHFHRTAHTPDDGNVDRSHSDIVSGKRAYSSASVSDGVSDLTTSSSSDLATRTPLSRCEQLCSEVGQRTKGESFTQTPQTDDATGQVSHGEPSLPEPQSWDGSLSAFHIEPEPAIFGNAFGSPYNSGTIERSAGEQ